MSLQAPSGTIVGEVVGLLRAAPSLLRPVEGPRGEGGVLVVPGFLTGDRSTRLLRRRLRALGYRAEGWGLGINRGSPGRFLGPLEDRTRALAAATGGPVHLVGWSLGGILVREVSRRAPEVVAQVVTLGTPVIGGPGSTVFAPMFRLGGTDLAEAARAADAHEARPLPRPVTALYSRGDGIVVWQACLDPNHAVEHVEVAARHFAMGFDPEVARIVAERLATGRSA